MNPKINILERVHDGRSKQLPPRILFCGPEGVGKTTWASHAPEPVFICPEDGLFAFDHLPRFVPGSLIELTEYLQALRGLEKCPYGSLVIDTADWLERLIHRRLCERDGKPDIEAYGYGKGYTLAEAELGKVLAELDAIRVAHGLWIILLAHVQISKFDDPAGESWDRYSYKGNKKFGGILREWPDACLFAVYEVHKTKDREAGRAKVIGGDRIVHTEWSPGWDAKNRLSLPATLPLDWDAFVEAYQANRPEVLRARVKALAASAKLPEKQKAQAEEWLAKLDRQTPEKLKEAIAKLEKLQA
jgi:DNA polymerase III delta prime subunit